jgi:DNA (cytosine-5)-methyltransferase 1
VRPRLLDLFCGAGGAAVGYHQAGFDVVGVDHLPQRNYPFPFICRDALAVLRGLLEDEIIQVGSERWRPDAIHASPPCQEWTAYRRKGHGVGDGYGDLVTRTRELLNATGLPWVIENVHGAPLHSPLMLCGSMFDPPLDVQRHRYFETDFPLDDPAWPCRHDLWSPRYPAATNRRENSRRTVEVGVWRIPLAVQQAAMGIDWMTLEELSEAIPPIYTTFIGEQLMAHLKAQVAA